ncbi:hypothetical protein HOLleu_18254 [Holothuria leucospilota]|uniref:RING-type domain-containing protein n=1 Tax=Holothuria leucospilota TaxID=206669 RepID=A0A9Q1H9Q2_HOLLE|nr:hypothetical protein HOLleu_18254 [Holothuria leucospilota]
MDHTVNLMMQSDLSFLTPTQTEVFTTLQRLFPNVSKDVLVVTLTSPDIYYDGIDKLLLLNRCMDEMEAQSLVIDLTGRSSTPTDIANVASTSKSTNNNNIIKVPSLDGDSLAPSVAADALQGTSLSAVQVGKEKIAEPVLVVNDSVEDFQEEERDIDDVTEVKVRDGDESPVANRVGSSESTQLDLDDLLDYHSDSSCSLPEVILLPDEDEKIVSTLELKNRMNKAGPSGKSSAFGIKNGFGSEIPKREVSDTEVPKNEWSAPWSKLADNSQKGHPPLDSDDDLHQRQYTTKVTGDLKVAISKKSVNSSSSRVDFSETSAHQNQNVNSEPSSGVKLTSVNSSMQKHLEVTPSASSQYAVIHTDPNVIRSKDNIHLESLRERGHSTPKQLSGSSSIGSPPELSSPSNGNLLSGTNVMTSNTCRIHRGIKQCDCKGHMASIKSMKLHSPQDGEQNGSITHTGLNMGKSHSQNLDTAEMVTSGAASKHNSQTPKYSGKDPQAGSSMDSIISTRVGQVRENLQLEKPQLSTSQPVKESGDSLPQRIEIAGSIHSAPSGSLSQAGGHAQETFHKSKVATSTPQTVKQLASSPVNPGDFHIVKTVGSMRMVLKRVEKTSQPCSSKQVTKESSTLASTLNPAIHNPRTLNASESQVASQGDVGKPQEVKQTAGSTSRVGGNLTGNSVVKNTLAGGSGSMNQSKVKSQVSQNNKTDTLGKTQTLHMSPQAFYVRDTQAGRVSNLAARPQSSTAQVGQNNGNDTPGRSQREPQSSQAVQARLAQAAVVLNPTAITLPFIAQMHQHIGTTTPGRSQTGPLSVQARLAQAAVVSNPMARPQPSSAQIGQNSGTATPERSQTGPQSSTVFHGRLTQAGMVLNPPSRPRSSIAQICQSSGKDTPGASQRGLQSSQAIQARPTQAGVQNPMARHQGSGAQPARLQGAYLAQRRKAIKTILHAIGRQDLPRISQANATSSGNTQTVRMAEQVLGNAAFLPRNVALNQVQRQNNPRPENGFPLLPQRPAPLPAQNGIVGGGAIHQGVCQVHGGLQCNCPPPYQDRDIFEVTEQTAVDVSPFMAKVLNLFPDADPDFVKQKLQTVAQSVPDPVQWVCNLMLEDSYPRKQVPVRTKTPPPSTSKEFDYINKWRELPQIENRGNYIMEARQVLAFSFKLVCMASIDEVMRATRYRFTPAFVVLEKIVQSKDYIKAEKSNQRPMAYHPGHPTLSISCELPGEVPGLPNGKKFEEKRFRIKLNRKRRTNMMPCTNKELKKEMEYYKNFVREKQEEQDHQMALHINEEEYEQNQQGIECECCFVEHPFENMVQCFEMHLFCSDCLQRYLKEAIYGQGKGNLACMATDCSSTFPRDQIEKSLPPDLLAKYDERCREESVHLADLEDLVRCPHCQFAATLPLEMKAFLCPQCGKETCRDCQQDWKDHFGKKCEELESKSEEQLRTKYEEKLTEALIRTCHRCKASIVKENGCNKMTCRCGAKMCYICRKPNIDYNHFCQHVRDPSRKGCNQCNACCLWEVAEIVDEKKMKEIVNEMQEEQKEKGIDERKRTVGVPDNIGAGPSKKPRTQ